MERVRNDRSIAIWFRPERLVTFWAFRNCPIGIYLCDADSRRDLPTFMRQADKLFSEDEKRELIDFLAKTDLTPNEKRVVSALAAALKATRKEIK